MFVLGLTVSGCYIEIQGYRIRHYIDQCGGADKLHSVYLGDPVFAICTDGRRIDYK